MISAEEPKAGHHICHCQAPPSHQASASMIGMLSTLVKNRVWAMGCLRGIRLISRLLTAMESATPSAARAAQFTSVGRSTISTPMKPTRAVSTFWRDSASPASQTASGTISSGAA